MPTRYDAIVIGTGQAGPPLAARLAAEGRRIAVLERLRFGGTCVNNGCIPTKTLVASARAIHVARRGAEFGFSAGAIRTDMTRVKARKDAMVHRSRDGIEKWMKETPGITVYRGHGRFEGPHTVRVDHQVIESEQIFINVGARAFVPDMPGVQDAPFLTNSTILDLEAVPEHLVVIGGSYIGLELGQVYRRLGSQVTVIERAPRIIAREDEDVSAGLQQVLEREGIVFRLNATCMSIARGARGVNVSVDCTHGAPAVEGTHALLAVGRRPNTDDLGLEHAGVETDERGYIRVDDQCRTNVPGVWAIGECNGRGAFTHTSYNDYEVVADHLLGDGSRGISDRIPCYALYTDPPVGRAGMTLAEARASGREVLVAHRPMERVSRASEMSETQGFMRALVDAGTMKLMGAVVFAHGGDEIIHTFIDAMYAQATATALARAMHIHPTITEYVPTLMQDLKPLD